MNFGQISKKIAFQRGFAMSITPEDGVTYGEGREFAPGKLEKANAAFDKLREQMEKKWKLAPPKKAKKVKR